jgi:hypothetical protein
MLIWREKRPTGEKIQKYRNVDNMTRNIQRAQNNVKQHPYTTCFKYIKPSRFGLQ